MPRSPFSGLLLAGHVGSVGYLPLPGRRGLQLLAVAGHRFRRPAARHLVPRAAAGLAHAPEFRRLFLSVAAVHRRLLPW